ncbi:INO80 complex, subunit Ies4 [Exophiala viscosa]|uniref:INO80 complex, subunit Ies4 n=1 Tax=Exophiala viscosa TaxID=2486360 RepID=A0AAN6DPU2_9EURO|nr:INO80 complex, subunit Ies4 [Exophiala viscosa]KAI1620981.1 INO80 complex, subunit Ies4 [Exophiala viscosa]
MAVSSSSTPGRSPSAAASKPDKTKKQTKTVILKLSPKILRRFQEPTPKSEEQSTASVASSPAPAVDDATIVKAPENNDNASESNSTPAPATDSANGEASKKRKAPGAGSKRSLGQMIDTADLPKPRGKPGPKKKARLEDGAADSTVKMSVPAFGPSGQKLGPKANQGAINAGLRNLDRSGKPCRKWIKKAFSVKSFTGVSWDLPSWRGNERPATLNGEDSSEAKDITQQSSSDIKPNESDTAMDSNAGEQPDPMLMSTPAASSPAPMPPPSSVVAAQG